MSASTPHIPSPSLKQNQEKSLALSDTPFDPRHIDTKVLARLFASQSDLGKILRTLAYYSRYPQPPRRDQDMQILLLVSNAIALTRRRP